jgi:hypothetical protein
MHRVFFAEEGKEVAGVKVNFFEMILTLKKP